MSQVKLLSTVMARVLKNNLRLSPPDTTKLTALKQELTPIITNKITNLNSWYTKLLGLDEVKQYQDRVVLLQEKLLVAQDTRREIGTELAEIRRRSKDLQDQIHKVKRQDDLERFLDLMKEETEILRQENQISLSFNECDRTERELFSAFTNAVRDSHEKQRAQLEYTKYFGIILSIAGSLLAFLYTTFRKADLKRFIEANVNSETVVTQLRENQKQFEEAMGSISNVNPDVMREIDRNHDEIKRILASQVRGNKDTDRILWYGAFAILTLIILKMLGN